MDFDDIALSRFEGLKKEWVNRCSQSGRGICDLANRYRQRDDCHLRSMHSGSFNFSFRLHWDDGGEDWLIRFPLAGKSMFPNEKVHGEALLMKYIADHTSIPVPRVIGYGTDYENPTGLGPYIIMTWVEGRKMSELLRKDASSGKDEALDLDIDGDMLRVLYGQMAHILLELWKLDFDRIGSLGRDEGTGESRITERPVTLAMNELVRTCGLVDSTPTRTYTSSADYIISLLESQSTHLQEQRNSIYDSTDCREKYACRHLMKAIALSFLSEKDNHGPFKLFGDDLCPGNVLVNDSFQITGVIDWEFCYAAPAQFAGSIPWWLLLERPHRIIYNSGVDTFFDQYLPKADVFLQCLEQKEAEQGIPSSHDRLSARMRQSIRDRSAWFNLACRMVPSVDMIYWDLVDEYCWGSSETIAERVYNFTATPEMHRTREEFVRTKVKQLQEYYAELGEDTKVFYEEEQFRKTELERDKDINPKNLSGHLLTGAVVFSALAFAAHLILRRHRP
ncbi:hypothetical protein BO94DRAFT_627266 [Aspergillus sclerotioniger CBS 115572]|uniref:Aminoglycoside phosphotransferase domain-containing protein n=1 Tax=Aspergillus sclerotioniger CBS 115572 TaxID=1450535 RepID=A0A317VQT2_9EURO|nr:hypothetical protein BO94DRAFT_627266 [Aspergillus sclerotioniger CBS 115572]PWY75252.1 hypothetical protein BO94DRAFT_627266 [Aspergillus sclerotioniger CBS 115572]